MKFLLKKFRTESRRQDFLGSLEKFQRNPKEFQREGVVAVVLMIEDKAFSEEKRKILQVAPNCAALRVFSFGGGYLYLDGPELRY